MTVTEAYNTDDTLRGLIDYWVEEKVCPLPLADRFYDLDMPDKAEVIKTLAGFPKRKVFYASYFMDGVEESYVYPAKTNYKKVGFYFFLTRSYSLAHHLPVDNGIDRFISGTSVLEVILRLLEEYELVKSPNP